MIFPQIKCCILRSKYTLYIFAQTPLNNLNGK
jgi:hypothetical protein